MEDFLKIENSVLVRCNRATQGHIVIPDSVTKIGKEAFYGCSLTSIEIPNSVTEIGEDAFRCCSRLRSIEIPNSVTEIGEGAFFFCTGLTSIEIPNSVTEIGKCAFYNCYGLTSIEIPNSVTKIGEGAFSGCDGLTSIIVDERNKHYSAEDGNLYSKDKTLLHTGLPSTIGVVKVPNSVTEIGECAFSWCTGLTSIEIPDSVTEIGKSAFYYCTDLTSITVDERNKHYSAGDGILYSKDKTLLHTCLPSKIGVVKVPDSVTEIGKYAFYDCKGLTSIEIPNSVTKIGKDAFYCCRGLTSIVIPNSVTEIGDWFGGCENLREIHCRIEHPGKVEFDCAFNDIDTSQTTVYVPIGTGYEYRHHPVFKDFKKIVTEKALWKAMMALIHGSHRDPK